MEEINYLKIVLDGYLDGNSRKYLKDYFKRQWKKAEANHYSIEEFFVGLRSVVKAFEEDINLRKAKRINELYILISLWKEKDLPDEEKAKQIQDFKDEIEFVKNQDSHFAHLPGITNQQYVGNLTGTEVKYIKDSILLAFGDLSPEDQEEESFEDVELKKGKSKKEDIPKKTFEEYFISLPKDIKGLKEYMAKRKGKELAGIICVLQENGYLPEKINRSGFLKSIGGSINISGVNDFLKEDEDLMSVISYDRDYLESIQKQIVKFV